MSTNKEALNKFYLEAVKDNQRVTSTNSPIISRQRQNKLSISSFAKTTLDKRNRAQSSYVHHYTVLSLGFVGVCLLILSMATDSWFCVIEPVVARVFENRSREVKVRTMYAGLWHAWSKLNPPDEDDIFKRYDIDYSKIEFGIDYNKRQNKFFEYNESLCLNVIRSTPFFIIGCITGAIAVISNISLKHVKNGRLFTALCSSATYAISGCICAIGHVVAIGALNFENQVGPHDHDSVNDHYEYFYGWSYYCSLTSLTLFFLVSLILTAQWSYVWQKRLQVLLLTRTDDFNNSINSKFYDNDLSGADFAGTSDEQYLSSITRISGDAFRKGKATLDKSHFKYNYEFPLQSNCSSAISLSPTLAPRRCEEWRDVGLRPVRELKQLSCHKIAEFAV